MLDRNRIVFLTALAVLGSGASQPLSAQTRQSQVAAEQATLKDAGVRACSLLTNAEIRTVTGRNDPWELNEEPYDRNSLCDFSGIVTIRVYAASGGREAIEAVLKNYQVDQATRIPVSGFGSGAFLMYPKPRDEWADTYILLVGDAGPRMFMLSLVVPDGSPPESVRPQMLELARTVLARLR